VKSAAVVVPLSGRTAIVTGAAGGVGRGIAEVLGEAGAATCLVGRNLAALQETASKAGADPRCYPTDLTDDAALQSFAEQVQRERSSIDVLVHCAGVHAMGAIEEAPVSELDAQYRANVRAPYLLTQALLPALRHSQGQVVFVNSSVGLTARGRVGAYASTKHALRAIADSLREEVNETGVRVMSVYLGRTASPMQAAIHAAEGKQYRPADLLQPSDVAAMILAALTLPWTAEVTELSVRPMRK
jgi:NAD(P)-dependent dehydrogenase (short-subunit alcohol dehydrogenase family)